MRYLVASDLHYRLPQLDWIAEQASDFDAVVLAGDHLDLAGHADLTAQITLITAYLGRLAESVQVFANSGNHDLTARRPDGEKAATWLESVPDSVVTDGRSDIVGTDLVSVCAWWEGPNTQAEVRSQLAVDFGRRPADGCWIWVYHNPPESSPTSWSGRRHFGDQVLNDLIDEHAPDLVLCGHVHEAPMRPEGSWNDRIGETLVLNAGRQAGPIPAHLIVDTNERDVAWWTIETGMETIAL